MLTSTLWLGKAQLHFAIWKAFWKRWVSLAPWTVERWMPFCAVWLHMSFMQTSAALVEKAMAPHSSTLAWKIPWMEEPGRLQSMGLLRVGHDWATSLSLFTLMHWRRKWQPTPVFLPGESQGRGSLVGCRLWGRTELDTTEVTYLTNVFDIKSHGQRSLAGYTPWGCKLSDVTEPVVRNLQRCMYTHAVNGYYS